MAESLVTIATFRNANEAELARMHLEAEGIAAFLADLETVNQDWLLGTALGNVKLQVPRAQAEAAAAILARVPRPRPADAEDETEADEATRCLACGEPMPESESRCPSCGWSYAGEAET